MKIQFKAAAYLTEQKQSVMKTKIRMMGENHEEDAEEKKLLEALTIEVEALKKINALPEKPFLDICRKVMKDKAN